MKTPIIPSRQLLALSALAEHLNYTRAADALGVTQSAVTHAIQALEETLGIKLVGLVGNRVKLNRAGMSILSSTRRILSEMREIRAKAEGVRLQRRRTWRLRASSGRKAA